MRRHWPLRRWLLPAAGMLLLPAVAAAQGLPPSPPITATPLMPPSVQYAPQFPNQPPSAPAPAAPAAPPTSQPATPQQQSPQAQPQTPPQAPPPPAAQSAPQPAPPPPNTWLPQGSAVLQALDKVNAQTAALTVKVGQTAKFGTLSIAVQACVVRPPDMPQGAAAALTITDSHADQPGFKGWMLKSDPALSMLQHPIYDVRVIGCAP